MEPIYKKDFPMPGINFIEIYSPVNEEENIHYLIKVDGKDFDLRINSEGMWSAEDLNDDIAACAGTMIEYHEL